MTCMDAFLPQPDTPVKNFVPNMGTFLKQYFQINRHPVPYASIFAMFSVPFTRFSLPDARSRLL